MDKIYENAVDLHVRSYVVYGKSDKKLYREPGFKNQVTQAELEDAFAKGALLIVDGASKLVPVSITANKVATVGMVSSDLALVEWTAVATA